VDAPSVSTPDRDPRPAARPTPTGHYPHRSELRLINQTRPITPGSGFSADAERGPSGTVTCPHSPRVRCG
jgi:hypothetical protein